MASVSQVIVLRLRSGGVLLITPAFVLPWPRLVGRKVRRLQEYGVHRALADPQAMSRLRRELPRLTDFAHIRGAQPDSDAAIAKTLLDGVRTGKLTLMFGAGDSSMREAPVRDWTPSVQQNPVVNTQAGDVREPTLDLKNATPAHTVPVPGEYADRMLWVCGRSIKYMSSAVELEMREFFSDTQIGVTSSQLTTWANTKEAGAGFTVDAAMFATALWALGHEAGVVFDDLSDAFVAVRAAAAWGDLDDAAERLSATLTKMKAPLVRQFLRRIGDRTGR